MTAEDENTFHPKTTDSNKQSVVFTGHNAYVMSCARMNRDASQFTDVVLICPDGNVTAHRLVLAAASSTLRKAFLEVPANDAMPEGLHEHTILVPDVKKSVVAGLIDFLYTVSNDLFSATTPFKLLKNTRVTTIFPASQQYFTL